MESGIRPRLRNVIFPEVGGGDLHWLLHKHVFLLDTRNQIVWCRAQCWLNSRTGSLIGIPRTMCLGTSIRDLGTYYQRRPVPVSSGRVYTWCSGCCSSQSAPAWLSSRDWSSSWEISCAFTKALPPRRLRLPRPLNQSASKWYMLDARFSLVSVIRFYEKNVFAMFTSVGKWR